MNINDIYQNREYSQYMYIGIDACGCISLFTHKPVIHKIEENYIWVTPWWFKLIGAKDIWIKCCTPNNDSMHLLTNCQLFKRSNI